MNWIDLSIFFIYMAAMLGVGYYFLKSNKGSEDYYLAGRNMGPWHIGMSVVATDVGGGFSIGLGGLGFTMGISGSWMLFTGLIGAWLAAAFLIPKVFELGRRVNLFTFPQVFGEIYGKRVALLAAIISAIGYLGFTSSQMLAGAKLASATFPSVSLDQALLIMGVVAVIYTVMGGLKAVIYTDTIQWIILLSGLIFIGLPLGYISIGGMEGLRAETDQALLSMTNLSWQNIVNWSITIIPIWFIGMTLYQRIYASRDVKQAKKAWYIAGIFEWPIMAFMGVLLGLFAKVAAEQGMFAEIGYASAAGMDAEIGLPLLLRTILPVGLMGLMMSAYFSAILSTADSCLMACSGNIVSDIMMRFGVFRAKDDLRLSQWATLVIGAVALLIALYMESVLELMLHSYAFMVSGLFIPVLFGLYSRQPSEKAAMFSMIIGGTITLTLTILIVELPFGLDPITFGLLAALLAYLLVPKKPKKNRSVATKRVLES
ncbi:MAG: SSS family solute:Na+ symporter [Cryomorphaceae bacterium]|jgi:SSS family solute:Na+ symporter